MFICCKADLVSGNNDAVAYFNNISLSSQFGIESAYTEKRKAFWMVKQGDTINKSFRCIVELCPQLGCSGRSVNSDCYRDPDTIHIQH